MDVMGAWDTLRLGERVIEELGLGGLIGEKIEGLSGGERKRASLGENKGDAKLCCDEDAKLLYNQIG